MKVNVLRLMQALFLSVFAVVPVCSAPGRQSLKTKHLIFVMTDGLRWQELFRGVEEMLIASQSEKDVDLAAVRKAYWRETPEARREALMPFLWSVVARNGQVYGNRDKGSEAFVTNGLNFSYPGYSETLCGIADPRVTSNDKVPNPNRTVLEWLNNKPAFRDRMAAFGAWDVFPYIFNVQRSGLPVNAGWDDFRAPRPNARLELLNQLKADTPRVWKDEPFDALPFYTAIEYLKTDKPKVLYLGLGETDEWAHAGNYSEYLNATHRVDQYLRTIWETVQNMSEYRGNTTLLFTPDHGRGEGPVGWQKHGEKVPDSKYIWMAFVGPDTPALGERSGIAAVKQDQIAATLAALLGQDYSNAEQRVGKPIIDVLPH